MNYVTTSNEMQALLFADPEFQQALDDTLLNAFWSEVGPNNYVNKEEDVRCAWSNLPLAEKMDFVHDVFPTVLDLLQTTIQNLKQTSSWSNTSRLNQGA